MSIQTISSAEQLYKFLRETRSKLIANMIFSASPGHIIHEMDYFLRQYLTHAIDRETTYYWIQRGGSITEGMVETYAEAFRRDYNLVMIADDQMFDWANDVCRMIPEFGVDVGLGHIRNSLMSRENTWVQEFHYRLHYHVTNDAVVKSNRDYYLRRAESGDADPWTKAKPSIDGPLADLIGDGLDRIAAVHIRTNTGNAGVAVPAETLVPTLAYLRDEGYRIVKVGTEPYPAEFAQFDVVNYSESPVRSFKNDLAILANAKITLINTSGLENVADVMDLPCVSYGNWPLTAVTYSKNTIVVPSLLSDPVRERMLTFSEQMLVFKSRPEYWENERFTWHVPFERFGVLVPRPDELLAATQEALLLGQGPRPLTELQTHFKQLDGSGLMAVSQARISDYFLQRFRNLL